MTLTGSNFLLSLCKQMQDLAFGTFSLVLLNTDHDSGSSASLSDDHGFPRVTQFLQDRGSALPKVGNRHNVRYFAH